ncbi:caspase family protein [Actinomadura sp. NAK00032]|uniref:caspase family protein n=1 Tax=Actinomadura sp. NAK00032 TaxID=2742128 RepID=UPI0015908F80|nr:caspase family protein [Actinomadura sp. NAK00032]QKW37041.1 caspase family protein [Actinomadura sp. NAK00032]
MRLPDADRSRVVLIGTTRYADEHLPDLPTVGQSLADLARVLTDPEDGIVPAGNCTTIMDEGDIRRLGRTLKVSMSRAEDLLLVYYAGHGLVGGKRHELYLALPDSEWGSPEFSALEYEKLRGAILDSPASSKVVILDCCFSGRVLAELMSDPVTSVLGQIDVHGTYVLTSAQRDQVALALPGEKHTAFTGRLLTLLETGIPDGPELLTIESLYQRLRAVMKAEGLPTPEKRATRTAELITLTRNRNRSAAGTPLAPPSGVVESKQTKTAWDPFRQDRGNSENEYTSFETRRRLYWIITVMLGVLGVGLIGGSLLPATAVGWRAALGAAGAFVVLLCAGFFGMARRPLRLEIGRQGIQVFARSGTSWLPWTVLDKVTIERIGGVHHVVALLEEAEIFPDFDAFGGGPRFLERTGKLDICAISILRAGRHDIARALVTYGGGLLSAEALPRPPIDMSGERWGDALATARVVEQDRHQRPVDRRFSAPEQAAVARDALMRELAVPRQGEATPHVRPWVWTPRSGGAPLTEHGRQTGVELRLSYYTNIQISQMSSVAYSPMQELPPVARTRQGQERLVWRIVASVCFLFSGIMEFGAIGAAVTGGFPDTVSAIIGNVMFGALFLTFALVLAREALIGKRKWSQRLPRP